MAIHELSVTPLEDEYLLLLGAATSAVDITDLIEQAGWSEVRHAAQ